MVDYALLHGNRFETDHFIFHSAKIELSSNSRRYDINFYNPQFPPLRLLVYSTSVHLLTWNPEVKMTSKANRLTIWKRYGLS
jgi:hypothetical protein